MALYLGKNPATPDPRDLKLANYIDLGVVLPSIPKTFGHETGITFGMDGNGPDNSVRPGFHGAGDCVFAGACHETQVWHKASGRISNPFNGASAIHDYSAVTGYVIGDESTDKGTNVREALVYRKHTGITDTYGGHHRIAAYVALEPGNMDHLIASMYLFGAVGIGINFPSSAMDQFNKGRAWSVVRGSSIEGGHYIPLVARRSSATLRCVTWGKVQAMTNSFYRTYCDEAWAILSPEAINAVSRKSAEGFDLSTLKRDLAALS